MSTPIELGPRLAVGRTAEIFAWGDSQILKLYQAWVPPGDADHEIAITQSVEPLGLPIARCYGRMDLDGRVGVLFERVKGTSQLDVLLRDPARAPEIAHTLAELHARMHALKAPALPGLRQRLPVRIGQATSLSPAWREAALRQLQDLPESDALCHGDFHPGNVLLTPAGPVIIDWIDASHGHPLADVARTVVLVRYSEAPYDPAVMAVIAQVRTTFIDAYLAAYRALAPAAEADLARWLPVIMAARLGEGADNDQGAMFTDLAAAFGPPGA